MILNNATFTKAQTTEDTEIYEGMTDEFALFVFPRDLRVAKAKAQPRRTRRFTRGRRSTKSRFLGFLRSPGGQKESSSHGGHRDPRGRESKTRILRVPCSSCSFLTFVVKKEKPKPRRTQRLTKETVNKKSFLRLPFGVLVVKRKAQTTERTQRSTKVNQRGRSLCCIVTFVVQKKQTLLSC